MKNEGKWVVYNEKVKYELEDTFYDLKLKNGTVKLARFKRETGLFHSNSTGEPYTNIEDKIVEIRKSFTKVSLDCLICKNSFSLPAGDPFDDGSISDTDRLVCVKDKTAKIVQDDGYCDFHSENNKL